MRHYWTSPHSTLKASLTPTTAFWHLSRQCLCVLIPTIQMTVSLPGYNRGLSLCFSPIRTLFGALMWNYSTIVSETLLDSDMAAFQDFSICETSLPLSPLSCETSASSLRNSFVSSLTCLLCSAHSWSPSYTITSCQQLQVKGHMRI
jgi:hypothetical protein